MKPSVQFMRFPRNVHVITTTAYLMRIAAISISPASSSVQYSSSGAAPVPPTLVVQARRLPEGSAIGELIVTESNMSMPTAATTNITRMRQFISKVAAFFEKAQLESPPKALAAHHGHEHDRFLDVDPPKDDADVTQELADVAADRQVQARIAAFFEKAQVEGLPTSLAVHHRHEHDWFQDFDPPKDDADVAQELADLTADRKEQARSHHGGWLGVNKACYRNQSSDRRLFLMSLIHPFQGSTALEGLLMSSKRVSTLCSYNAWECEGRKIMEGLGYTTSNASTSDSKRETSEMARLDLFDVVDAVLQQYVRSGSHRLQKEADAIVNELLAENTHMRKNALDEAHVFHPPTPGIARYDITKMLAAYSRYWNLSREVLFDKSPNLLLNVQQVYDMLKKTPLPRRMLQAGITSLNVAYVMMWRPLCLIQLSRHAAHLTPKAAARRTLKAYETHVYHHQWALRRKLPILVINLGKLIWEPVRQARRLRHFAPCLGPMNPGYVPQLGIDIFEGNFWKADGSILAFGRSVDPASVQFTVSHNKTSCVGKFSFEGALRGRELKKALEAQRYLEEYS